MNSGIEVRDKESFPLIIGVDGERIEVLHLNDSARHFPKPWESLSHLIRTLDALNHPVGLEQTLRLNLEHISKILGTEKPTPEQEASLTAALSAGGVKFSLGRIPKV